jgi:hypothetical protein
MKKLSHFILFLYLFSYNAFASTQSEVYLQHVEYCLMAFEALEGCQIDDHESVINLFQNVSIQEQDRPEYVQCVTAQPSDFYAYHVVAEKLLDKQYGLKRDHFTWIRCPLDPFCGSRKDLFELFPSLTAWRNWILSVSYQNPHIFDMLEQAALDDEQLYRNQIIGIFPDDDDDDSDEEEEIPNASINDTNPAVAKEILSVNFSLETYQLWDSAVWFFLNNSAGSFRDVKPFLRNLFDSCHIPVEAYEPYLDELASRAPKSHVGILHQIFIPKEKAQDYMFIATAGGYIDDFESFETHYAKFQQSRLQDDFRTFRNFQARVIVGCLFNDPDVKIISHNLFSEEDKLSYERFVEETIEKILQGGLILIPNK